MIRRRAAVAVALAAAGCASASSETTQSEWRHSGPPLEIVENAEAVLSDVGDLEAGWTAGVVIAEADKGRDVVWAVATPAGGMSLLGPSWNCDGNDEETDLWVLVDPGDLVVWDTEGDDLSVCADEIRVESKAAAQRVDG